MEMLRLYSARLSGDRSALEILDQTKLPGRAETLRLSGVEDIREAICLLKVRGAPAIGIAAAFGLYLAAKTIEAGSPEGFLRQLGEKKAYLMSARPTAVNLCWALDRTEAAARRLRAATVPEMVEALYREASAILEEDIAVCRRIGENGLRLLRPGCSVLTHCNAGTLATGRYGTALAPVYIALERGMEGIRVFCCETRPLLQGARLTALEMHSAGVDTTLICDNMASIVMQKKMVDLVLVGCDRVARNGDTANKIGTSGAAILAGYYGIPFYVCSPVSTIDPATAHGGEIRIEERPAGEVTEMWYRERMAPEGVKVFNPAFDVTDHSLITGIITEKGIAHPPFERSFAEMGIVRDCWHYAGGPPAGRARRGL